MRVQWLESVKKRRKGVCFAVGMNFLAMIVILVLMRPSFETNDDIVFAELGSGLRGVKDAHLVFQNYILGLIYRFLYQLTGRLPWYTIFQYAVLLAAFSAVTYVLMNSLESYCGLCLSVIVLCGFGYEAYIHIQFTKTAGIAAAAGVFLLLYAAGKKSFSIWTAVWGTGLGLLGFMYREDQFWASSALMAGAGIYFLLTVGKKYPGKFLQRLGVCVGSLLVLLAAVAFAGVIDSHMYRAEEWREYQEFNDLRSRLLDYGFPDYDSSREIYEELGITREAYELYKTWNFNDPEKFTSEIMEELVSEKTDKIFRGSQILNFLKRFPTDLAGLPIAWFAAGFLFIWLIFSRKNAASVFSLVFETVLILALYFYLYYQGRYMVNRVDVGLWFSVCLVILSMFSEKKGITGQAGLVLCVTVFALSQFLWCKDWRISTSSIPEARISQRAVLETIGTDKEHIYLAKSGTVSEIVCYGPFDRMPENLLDNLFWFGGWECRMPGIVKKMESRGIANPYRDMINNEKVYLIDDQIQLTMEYIHRYYDADAEAVFVKTLGNVDLYQIVG